MTESHPLGSNIDQLIANRFTSIENAIGRHGLLEVLAKKIITNKHEGVNVLALIGGAASGKTTLAQQLIDQLSKEGLIVDVIGTDDYLIENRAFRRQHVEHTPLEKYDFKLMNQKIEAIRKAKPNEAVKVPTYDPKSGIAIAVGEANYTRQIGLVDVLIVEGDFPKVDEPDLTIFFDIPDEDRLRHRLQRDTSERDENEQSIQENFRHRQESQHVPYTLPAVDTADILIRGVFTNGHQWQYDVYQANQSHLKSPTE